MYELSRVREMQRESHIDWENRPAGLLVPPEGILQAVLFVEQTVLDEQISRIRR